MWAMMQKLRMLGSGMEFGYLCENSESSILPFFAEEFIRLGRRTRSCEEMQRAGRRIRVGGWGTGVQGVGELQFPGVGTGFPSEVGFLGQKWR